MRLVRETLGPSRRLGRRVAVLLFHVLSAGRRVPSGKPLRAYLVADSWDDWFKYSTLFHLYVADASGVPHVVGLVKIGQLDMPEGQRTPDLPSQFRQLGEEFFSLGQDDEYYSNLNALGDELRSDILGALRDVAADLELFEKVRNKDVTIDSLLRSVTTSTVRGQFHRMTQGGARLSRFSFVYEAPRTKDDPSEAMLLEFEVEPESTPPTNVHVLIGRNGVGKTYVCSKMAGSLLDSEDSSTSGRFSSESGYGSPFANLVSVSFSAFDEFEIIPDRRNPEDGIGYAYVGLRRTTNRGAERGTPKSPDMLKREFVESVGECLVGSRRSRWLRAIDALQVDPVFHDAAIASLADEMGEDLGKVAGSVFRRLSSGHKIILLTITRLVELVEERTLVMLDEPEAHLHPPLLSAFVRAVSDLLIDRNGVAVIATHSPVVLQEVPRSCVSVLRRSGVCATAERPGIETLGENVGVLTSEVFGLELTHSGFHELLRKSSARHGSYEAVLDEYGWQLGAEARALVRALVAETGTEARDA